MVAPEPRGPLSADPAAVIALLRRWLSSMLAPEAANWVNAEIDRQLCGIDERRLAIAVGLVGRKIGRAELSLAAGEVARARALRGSWQPELWGTDEAGRVAIVLATYHGDDHAFAACVDQLCANAELTELVAYLKGFAVFPTPNALYERAREGVRSSMRPVFEAIACHNPYPFDHFDEAAWNQMVVKSVFSGTPITTIVGLHERRNPELIRMLRDLADERRAAGRQLPDAVHAYIAG